MVSRGVFPSVSVLVAALALLLGAAITARGDTVIFSQGFETNNAGWDVFGGTNDATRVPSGTNGITSASGGFHATAAGPVNGPNNLANQDDGSAATNWGGYSSVFGSGFTTSLDMYLKFGTTNDTRFDWDSALNDSSGNFYQDFVFNGGYYNDTDGTGSGDRFVINASHNATRSGAFPKNGGSFTLVSEGWYTFQEKFYDAGGFVKVDLSILNSIGNLLKTWTLDANRPDLGGPLATASAGGNRYGWVVFNENNSLAIDNSVLSRPDAAAAAPLPTAALAGMSILGGIGGVRRLRRHRAMPTVA